MKHLKKFNESMSEKELKVRLTYHKLKSKREVKVVGIGDDTVDIIDISGDLHGKETTMKKSKFLKDFYR